MISFKNYAFYSLLPIKWWRWIVVAILSIFVFLGVYIIPPYDFPAQHSIEIQEGLTLSETADLLKKENVIRSPFIFKVFVYILGGERGVQIGEYFLPKPASVVSLSFRVIKGDFGFEPVKIVFPEGSTIVEIAKIAEKKLLRFNAEEFIKLTEGKEGYLFPDTYIFYTNTKTENVAKMLEENFKIKTDTQKRFAEKSGKDFRDIIIMASIIEEEARTEEDRKMISGILWKRIKIGMALQVDAPFIYSIGRNTYELTKSDLRGDSPYNTYQNRGLPVGPISNPGISSINAALYPTESPYLFYLSDKNGKVYYGKDFEEHKRNRELYL